MARIYNVPTQNALTKTLSSQLLAGATSAALSDVVGIPNDYFMMVIDRVDSNNQSTASKREYIECSGTSGSNVTITQRGLAGSTDQNHSVGAIVEFVFDITQAKAIKDTFETEHTALGNHSSSLVTTLKATGAEVTTGTDDAKIVTPKALADSDYAKTSDFTKATATENVAGTDDAKYLTALANVPAFNSSMSRQAIINGNFDVWQRGTSHTTFTDTVITFLADRWYDTAEDDGGTKPTLTRSRQLLTSGELYNSFYVSRLATNGAGSSFGANSFHFYGNKIENGTRNLCGNGKKVTLSFWAKSDIVGKKIGIYAVQNYGTGGSPTGAEVITGTNFTLSSTLTKYTYTFTTNTLSGKTFGTAFDDYFEIRLNYQWGTGTTATRVGSTGIAETYVGSGNIDIAQVQLCAGDVALPFMPKSFEEELRACQRYYEKSYDYTTVPGTANDNGETALSYNTGTVYRVHCPRFKVTKRIIPTTITLYDRAGNAAKITTLDSGLAPTNNVTPSGYDQYSTIGFRIYHSTTAFGIQAHWTAEAEL